MHRSRPAGQAGVDEEVGAGMTTSDGAGDLPELLAPVMLQLDRPDAPSAEVPSRVCDVEAADGVRRIVVDRPDLSGLEGASSSHRGEELTLLWVRPSGLMQVRAAAVAGSRPYGPVWVLTPMGAPTREQRREYFRVALDLPALLTPIADEAISEATPEATPEAGAEAGADSGEEAGDVPTPVAATLVELGEGGAVVSCDAGLPAPGTVLELSFTLQDRPVATAAEVLRHMVQPAGRPRAALRFLDPEAHGDHIRRVAFELQRTRARTRLD